MDRELVRELVKRKSGAAPVRLDERAVRPIAELLGHPDVNEYVRCCLPQTMYMASGVRVLAPGDILGEMHPEAAPGGFIRRFGYLVIAASVGGNVVCLHSPSGKVFWADHESFDDDSIAYEERSTGEWVYLDEYSEENVERALVHLSDNLEEFLTRLLNDELSEQLDSLD